MALHHDHENEFQKIEKLREDRANHFLGVAGLLLFLMDNKSLREIESPLITFPVDALDLLSICVPKNDIHPCPVFGFEENVWRWISKMSFSGIVVNKEEVILLTENVVGDSFSADFNPIGIKIVTHQIFNVSDEWKALDMALVWNGFPVKSTAKRIPIIESPGKNIEEWLIDNQKGSSQLELTLRKIKSQNAYNNVAFKGQVHLSGEFKRLVDPFDASQVPKVESGKYYDN